MTIGENTPSLWAAFAFFLGTDDFFWGATGATGGMSMITSDASDGVAVTSSRMLVVALSSVVEKSGLLRLIVLRVDVLTTYADEPCAAEIAMMATSAVCLLFTILCCYLICLLYRPLYRVQ